MLFINRHTSYLLVADKIFLFVSVGGIYTVIKSKAAVSVAELGDRYCLIGPYREARVWMEVEVLEPPKNEALMKAIQHLRDSGFRVTCICRFLVFFSCILDGNFVHMFVVCVCELEWEMALFQNLVI